VQLAIHVSIPVIIAGALMTSAVISANMLSYMMIGKINERVPEKERISYVRWGLGVRKRFKQLYPGHALAYALDCCFVLMAVCIVVLIRFWVFQ